jgi:hypothetical protein
LRTECNFLLECGSYKTGFFGVIITDYGHCNGRSIIWGLLFASRWGREEEILQSAELALGKYVYIMIGLISKLQYNLLIRVGVWGPHSHWANS